MSRDFVPPQVHAVLDYPPAAILIASPLVLDFDYKAATVIALIPLASHGGPLWEPMCYAQIGGLTVATFITLLLVPVIYPASLLYFVSGLLEDEADQPLIGMQRYLASTATSTPCSSNPMARSSSAESFPTSSPMARAPRSAAAVWFD